MNKLLFYATAVIFLFSCAEDPQYTVTVNIDYVRHTVVPWSFAFLDPIEIRQEEQVVLSARNQAGKVLLNFGLR